MSHSFKHHRHGFSCRFLRDCFRFFVRVFGVRAAACASALITVFSTSPVIAQTYPSKPVRLVAPYAAGGPTDSMARLIGTEMAKTLGQPVVVENRPGAAGAVGADVVAKAAPDGYTVCFCTTGPTILMPIMEPRLSYNAARDLAPVGQVHRLELSILVGPKIAAKNITALMPPYRGIGS